MQLIPRRDQKYGQYNFGVMGPVMINAKAASILRVAYEWESKQKGKEEVFAEKYGGEALNRLLSASHDLETLFALDIDGELEGLRDILHKLDWYLEK